MREKEKEERNIKEKSATEEIKIKIRPSQFQMTITFDRKLQLRRVAWLQKVYYDI
jgi:hypothetical protein